MSHRIRQLVFRHVQIIILTLLILMGGVFSVNSYQEHWQKVPAGTFFAGESISGMTRSQLRPRVQTFADQWEQEQVRLEILDPDGSREERQLAMEDLGVTVDVEATMNAFFRSAAATNVLAATEQRQAIAPVLKVPRRAVERVESELSSFERMARDASIYIQEISGNWTLKAHQEGRILPEDEERQLTGKLLGLAYQEDPLIQVTLASVESQISLEDLQELYVELQNLMARRVTWHFEGEERVFSLADYSELVSLDYADQEVVIDETKLRELLTSWFAGFDQEAGEVRLSEPVDQEKGHRLSSYTGEFVSGRRFLLDEMVERVITVLEADQEEEKIPVAYEEIAPEVYLDGVGELELLSRGKSSFREGNYADRVFNIKKGLALYDGMVLMPGEEFSFNQVLGYVYYEDGWKPALAIFGGGGVRKVPGGGLCQVSTTMYRAAVWAGLPTTQRKPHSLDVSYYHQYGYGIDAAIYPPADIDLRFVNDTPGPMVIHTRVDDDLEEAVVEIYGIDDGRAVELEQTINRSVKLPKQVEYTDQIDTGLQEVLRNGRTGRYIEWDWRVRKADGTLDERTIETLYPAERRVVRVGTG